jgi:hypothetical protein
MATTMGKAASVWRRGNWEAWSSGQECRRSEDDLPSPRTWLCLDAPSPVRHVLLEWISVDRQSRDSSPLQNRTRSSLNVARLSHGDEWEGEKVDGEISFKRRSNSVVAWTGEAAQSSRGGLPAKPDAAQNRTPIMHGAWTPIFITHTQSGHVRFHGHLHPAGRTTPNSLAHDVRWYARRFIVLRVTSSSQV